MARGHVDGTSGEEFAQNADAHADNNSLPVPASDTLPERLLCRNVKRAWGVVSISVLEI